LYALAAFVLRAPAVFTEAAFGAIRPAFRSPGTRRDRYAPAKDELVGWYREYPSSRSSAFSASRSCERVNVDTSAASANSCADGDDTSVT
jgi:hypothetical protein